MKQIMKQIILCLLAMAVILPARAQLQVTPARTYGAKETTKKQRAFPIFWSAARTVFPPLPFNPFPELTVYDAGNNNLIYDDREVDYPALEAATAKQRAEAEAEAGPLEKNAGGGGMAMMSMSGGLRLGTPVHDGTHLLLTIEGAEEGGRYDVYYSTNLTNWNYLFRTLANQTNLTILPPSDSMCFFQLGTLQDTDFDTLPDAFELLVAQLDPTTPNNATNVPVNNAAQPFLVDVPTAIVPTEQTKLVRGITLFPDGRQEGVITSDFWQRGSNGTRIITGIIKTTTPSSVSVTNIAWDAEGHPLPIPPFATAPAMPQGGYTVHGWSYYVAANPPQTGGIDLADTVTTKAGLQTGGKALSTNSNLIVVQVSASEQIRTQNVWVSTSPIPNQQISVLGETPDENGRVWGLYEDNQLLEATPVISGSTNYSYGLTPTKIRLRMFRNGLDVTDGFSTVWVGEQIVLNCQVDDPQWGISNLLWVVPGMTISNWSADQSRTYYEESYPKTNASVAYYWVNGLPEVTVTALATLGGYPLVARTRFQVQRPNATITAQIQNVVAVDNSWLAAPALHFGYAPPGIKFTYGNAVGAGLSYQWVQTANSVRRIRKHDDGLWYRSANSGLDTDYPYIKGEVNGVGQEWASDSPGTALDGDFEYVINESFTMHLMFKPQVNAANTIWVPLRKINWSWSGQTALLNGSYTLSNGNRSVDESDMDTTSHPVWDVNISPFNFVLE